jgi:hypothetical protein
MSGEEHVWHMRGPELSLQHHPKDTAQELHTKLLRCFNFLKKWSSDTGKSITNKYDIYCL